MEISTEMIINIKTSKAVLDSAAKQNTDSVKNHTQTIGLPESVLLNLQNGNHISAGSETKGVSIFSDILQLIGFKATPENIKMVRALLLNGFPASKENITGLNQAMRLMVNDIEKAMFFLKNNITVSLKNSNTIKSYINNEIQLGNQIQDLAESISNIDDIDLKNILTERLLGENAENIEAEKMQTGKTAEYTNPLDRDTSLEKLEQNTVNIVSTAPKETGNPETANSDSKVISKDITVEENIPETEKNIADLKSEFSKIKSIYSEHTNTHNGQEKISASLGKFIFQKISDIQKPESISVYKNILSAAEEIFGNPSKEYGYIEKAIGEAEYTKASPSDKAVKEKIISKYTIKAENADPKEIDKALNELKSNIQSLKTGLTENNPVNSKIIRLADDINRNIDFLKGLKNSIYVQVPMNINNRQTNVELYVFKHKGNKKTNSDPAPQSALISLDLLSLGHLETYIQKRGNNINCQFRVENDDIENFIKSNIQFLNDKLNLVNLNLVNCVYKKTEQPFNLTDKEPLFDENAATNTTDKIHTLDTKA